MPTPRAPSLFLAPLPPPSQDRMHDDFLRRFEELSADIDQLRLQVQRGTNTPSSAASTVTTTSHPPEPRKFFFYEPSELHNIPHLYDSNDRNSVFTFLTGIEKRFRLRNYELQLPDDNTEGWARYGMQLLMRGVETRALAKWGTSTNISWETFKEWLIKTFYNERVIRGINHDYSTLKHEDEGITVFNTNFLRLRLLLAFVGIEITEEAAIRDYQEKIAGNQQVALALAQFTTAEKICERDPKLTLEEVMDYCENVYDIVY